MGESLKHRRVLVVEDEYLLANAMGRGLRKAGAVVIGPVPSVDQALALVEEEGMIDGAVLDINLGERKVYPVVDALIARGTQVVFATGNDPGDVPPSYAHILRCEKPIDLAAIVRLLARPRMEEPLPSTPVTDAERRDALRTIRGQLVRQIGLADEIGQTLIAARLCEAMDTIDAALAS